MEKKGTDNPNRSLLGRGGDQVATPVLDSNKNLCWTKSGADPVGRKLSQPEGERRVRGCQVRCRRRKGMCRGLQPSPEESPT